MSKQYLTTQLLSSSHAKASRRKSARLLESYDWIIKSLQSGNILDIGPGRGELIGLFSENAAGSHPIGIHAIDIDEEVVEHIRTSYPDVHCERGDAVKLLENSSVFFDRVFLMQVVEHLEVDYAISLLNSIRGRLADGGILLIEVPNTASGFCGSTLQNSDITHRTAFTSVSLAQICREAGFEEVEIRGIRPTGTSPVRLIQRVLFYFLIHIDKLCHKILVPSWDFLHEPVIYAVCRKSHE